MSYTLAQFATKLITQLGREVETGHRIASNSGMCPGAITTHEIARAQRALEYALPPKVNGLAVGYAAMLRPDAPKDVRAHAGTVASAITQAIRTFDRAESRRGIERTDQLAFWIGQRILLSVAATSIRATEMYPGLAGGRSNDNGTTYGLSGVLLGYRQDLDDEDVVTIYLGAEGEALAVDAILPAVISQHPKAPPVHPPVG